VRKGAEGWRLRTASGGSFAADVVVLATTHPTSALPPQIAALRGEHGLVADPLLDNVVADFGADERVLVVGAGLTAADLVAALDARDHRAAITLISRRGLRARGRSLIPHYPEGDFLDPPARTATALLRKVRAAIDAAEAAGRSWEPVIEGVRNQGQDIWRALEPQARRRVVRHLRPFWDAHRFRAAPQIEAIVQRKLENGTLELKRARLGGVARAGAGYDVELLDLRRGISETRSFERIIVATGPSHRDVLTSQPFLAELAGARALSLDPTGLGLTTSRRGEAVGTDGAADPTLFVAGPLARGTFGELMGLPQVSAYAQFVAAQVSAALNGVKRGVAAPVA
jgi:uncharacterized NAD(P)/FAD-binding protein YdhS